MAKKPVKSAVKKVAKPVKKSAAAKKSTKPSKPKAPAVNPIEKINEEVLKQLKVLNIEPGLQADIQWCLGSYRNDKNPSGLYAMAEKGLVILKAVAGKDPKAVPTKLLDDIAKALKSR